MTKIAIEELDTLLPHQIYRSGRLLRFYLQKKLNTHETKLTPEQFFIIYQLYFQDGQAQRKLADKMLNDHPNITRLIDKLEKNGYLQRYVDIKDRRNFIIRLTPKARRLFEESAVLIMKERDRLLEGISKDDIRTVLNVLNRIEANMVE